MKEPRTREYLRHWLRGKGENLIMAKLECGASAASLQHNSAKKSSYKFWLSKKEKIQNKIKTEIWKKKIINDETTCNLSFFEANHVHRLNLSNALLVVTHCVMERKLWRFPSCCSSWIISSAEGLLFHLRIIRRSQLLSLLNASKKKSRSIQVVHQQGSYDRRGTKACVLVRCHRGRAAWSCKATSAAWRSGSCSHRHDLWCCSSCSEHEGHKTTVHDQGAGQTKAYRHLCRRRGRYWKVCRL